MRTFFALCACALLGVGCGESHGTSDGGPIGLMDGGGTARDAGPGPGVDSGSPGIDSGAPTVEDGGPAPIDGGTPTRTGAVGSACASDADCTEPAGSTCYTMVGSGGFGFTFPGGSCSAMCTPGSGSSECGAGADCFSVGFGGFGSAFCAKTCTSDADCRTDDGYSCMAPPFGGGSTMYCMPPRPTGGRDGGGFMFPGDGGGFMR